MIAGSSWLLFRDIIAGVQITWTPSQEKDTAGVQCRHMRTSSEQINIVTIVTSFTFTHKFWISRPCCWSQHAMNGLPKKQKHVKRHSGFPYQKLWERDLKNLSILDMLSRAMQTKNYAFAERMSTCEQSWTSTSNDYRSVNSGHWSPSKSCVTWSINCGMQYTVHVFNVNMRGPTCCLCEYRQLTMVLPSAHHAIRMLPTCSMQDY